MNALEIFNYASFYEGHEGYCPGVYDDMLRHGKRIFCIAADDNHNTETDAFGGFTVIFADKLEYEAVTDAMVRGDFYASMGPEIKSLTFEDGYINIECSDARRICLTAGQRRAASVWAKQGEALNFASFKVDPLDKYVRLTVTDFGGMSANTNGYFTDELFSE